MKDYVKDLHKRLSENIDETPELFHYDYFKLEGGELYYTGNRKPLTTEGKLNSCRLWHGSRGVILKNRKNLNK